MNEEIAKWLGGLIASGLLLCIGILLLEPKFTLVEIIGLFFIMRAATI